MTNTEPLIYHVRNYQLRFLGHILRLPEEEPASRYALYIPPHGNRRPGRPRTSYLAHIQRLLEYEEGRADSYACQRSKCMEKSCSRLLRSQKMMMMMILVARFLFSFKDLFGKKSSFQSLNFYPFCTSVCAFHGDNIFKGFRHKLQKSAPSGTNYKLSLYAPGLRFI